MRCFKACVKDRISKSGKGHPSSYRSSIHGHTWRVNGRLRVCELCGKTVKRNHEGKTIKNNKNRGE